MTKTALRTAQFYVSQKDHEWLYIFTQAAICHAGVRAEKVSDYDVILEVDESELMLDLEQMRAKGMSPQTTFRMAVEKMQSDLEVMSASGFHCSKSVIPDLSF